MSTEGFSLKNRKIAELNAEILKKGFCCSLGETRINLVPGEGNADSKIIFIGEGPGRKEDEAGRPFIGTAGKLLSEILAEIGIKREEVFIANVVKCRPPGNRDPKPEEVKACWPWLMRQIQIINPQLIIPLGRHAMERFLPDMKISAVRGKVLRRKLPEVGTRVFMPTYHPAAALYHREWLKFLQEDFAKIPKILKKLEEEGK
jgi:DNA polymerase